MNILRLIFASNNKGKIQELNTIFKEIGVEIVSLEELGINADVVEDKNTFVGNATKKAKEICQICNEPVIADDSGLCIDYLDGAPGVNSARYSAPNPTSEKNIARVLKELEGVPFEDRTAKFVCVLALAFPNDQLIMTRGECEGYISYEAKGTNGFGYSPVFLYEPLGKTFAELTDDEKNRISHRRLAIDKMKNQLKKFMSPEMDMQVKERSVLSL